MRNLKKILAMALALVMSLSLVTIANASDFSDDADISYKEAVDVMTAIGVIDGMDDGSFDPSGTLTREQAAKMICVMMLGKEAAEKLSTTRAPFEDVAATRWSAPYIAYCVEKGYIVGESSTVFNPTGLLTGHAFAKLLLCALGYDSTIQGYTGPSWSVAVATDAVTADIAVDGLLMSNNLSREQAAQMAFQTLTADLVHYTSKGTNITLENGTTIVTGASDPTKTTYTSEGSRNYAGSDDDDDGYGSLQFCEQYFSKLKARDGNNDDFGRPGTLWSYDGEDIGTYGNSADYSVVVEDAYADSDYSGIEDYLQNLFDDDDLVRASGIKYWVNGVDSTSANDFKAAAKYGTVVEAFVNDDDKITDVVAYYYTLAQIDEVDTDVTSKDERDGISAYVTIDGETYNNTDIPGYNASAYEEDAYVAVILNADDEIIASFIPEVVEGSISSRNASDLYVTMDGDRYYAVAASYTTGSFDVAVDKVEVSADNTYALYLDQNGNVLGIEGVATAANIDDVYYVDTVWTEEEKVAGKNVSSYYAQLVAMDGTVSEVELENIVKDSDDQNAAYTEEKAGDEGAVFAGKLVTISDKKWTDKTEDANSHKANNDKYDLELWDNDDYAVDAAITGFTKDFTKSATRITTTAADPGDAATYRLNSNTQYVFIEGSQNDLGTSVYTGGVAYDVSGVTSAIIITEDNSSVALYVLIRTDDADQSAEYSEDVIFIKSESKDVGDGYVNQTVYLPDGSSETWQVAEGEINGAGFYTYDTDSDGYYILDAAEEMNITEDFIWEDEEGVIAAATFDNADDLYETLLTVTVDEGTVSDIETADAAFKDLHDTDKDGQYDRSVSSLSRLADLLDNGRVSEATLYLNVSEDGAVSIFVTSVKAA